MTRVCVVCLHGRVVMNARAKAAQEVDKLKARRAAVEAAAGGKQGSAHSKQGPQKKAKKAT